MLGSMLDALVIVTIPHLITGAFAGERHFPAVGFVCQAISQCAECGMTVMGVDHELKMDPLTYTMFMAPACLCFYFCWDQTCIRMKHGGLLVLNIIGAAGSAMACTVKAITQLASECLVGVGFQRIADNCIDLHVFFYACGRWHWIDFELPHVGAHCSALRQDVEVELHCWTCQQVATWCVHA